MDLKGGGRKKGGDERNAATVSGIESNFDWSIVEEGMVAVKGARVAVARVSRRFGGVAVSAGSMRKFSPASLSSCGADAIGRVRMGVIRRAVFGYLEYSQCQI